MRDEVEWIQAGVRLLLRNAIERKCGSLMPRGLPIMELVQGAKLADADVGLEADRWCMRAEACPDIPEGVRDLMISQSQAVLEVFRASNA